VDDLDLANVLPVGQSFLWHRHQLTISSTGAAYDGEGVSTIKSEDGTKEAGHGVYEEFSRAIDNPPRVILLRQSAAEEVIYYTSVRPDASDLAEVKPVNGEQSSVVDEGSRADQRWLHDYFNLDRVPDLPSLYVSWIRDDPDLFGRTLGQEESERVLGLRNGDRRGDVVEHMTGRGIRVLEQDPWECLIAYVTHTVITMLISRFITSTNNHIPRIAGLMHRLCTHFSSPLLSLPTPGAIPPPPADPIADIAEGFDSALHDPTPLTTYHLFPSAASLAPVGEEPALEPILRELGFGYRAGFIASSLATLRARFGSGDGEVEKGLLGLRRASDPAAIPEVREVLLELKGIGRKVADCVMLMCLGQVSTRTLLD
jgi:N-glycosylase/DNA lyase